MNIIKIATAQFELYPVKHFQTFEDHLSSILEQCEENKVDLLVLPEYFSMQLVGLVDKDKKESELFRQVANYTPRIVDRLSDYAKQTKTFIVAGSMPVIEGGKVYNDSYVLSPGGNVFCQGKLNMTTYEKQSACISERNQLKVFDSKLGKFAINICYDIEFPEIARAVVKSGAQFIVVPSWTDDSHGFWRVRYCAQARCVENHIYVIQSSVVGSLNQEPAQDYLFGKSAILSPADKGFPDNGILAAAKENLDELVIANIDLNLLTQLKLEGTTTPCLDRESLLPKLEKIDTLTLNS